MALSALSFNSGMTVFADDSGDRENFRTEEYHKYDFSSEYEETGAAKVSANLISDMESGEGYDRATLNLMGLQLELIQEIKKLGKPIILVLIKGRPLLLEGIIQEVDALIGMKK